MNEHKRWINLILFAVMAMLTVGCASDSGDMPNTEMTTAATGSALVEIEYDVLQNIFLSVTLDTTIEEIEAAIADGGVCYSTKEYNKAGGGKSIHYRLAYTEDVATHYRPKSGDNLEVTFDKENGTLMTAEYSPLESVNSALLYAHGTWWHFDISNAEDYSGFYFIDVENEGRGITIKYTNGNERETYYIPCESAEAALIALMKG